MLFQRYAIFADAGYVYAAGGSLVLDDSRRANIVLEADQFLVLLRRVAEQTYGGGDFLRMYWYDAAPNAIHQSDHLQIGSIPGIKVRLGRLTASGQKGVDALIFRDMVKLASEHAISTAFLVSGDEDLRQAVEEAQDYGIKVVLIGIAPTLAANQSDILVREADALEVLGYEDLQDLFTKRELRPPFAIHQPPAAPDAYTAGDLEEAGQPSPEAATAPESPDSLPTGSAPPPATEDTGRGRQPFVSDHASAPASQSSVYTEIGRALGEEWLAQQPPEEIRFLRSGYPRIPRDIDSEILRRLVAAAGLPSWARVEEEARIDGRAGFWAALGLGVQREEPESRELSISETDPYQFGMVFAGEWMKRATSDDVEQARMLLLRNIGLPAQVDGLLLRVSANQFGDPVPVQVKHELRRGFRDGVFA